MRGNGFIALLLAALITPGGIRAGEPIPERQIVKEVIAANLFGTAIQTGVVMVVYLEEALERKKRGRGTAFSYADLIAAVKEGARLRLRPKVMTVATIVASLLPIMWSTPHRRRGDEAARHPGDRRNGFEPPPHPHRHTVTFVWLRARELNATRAQNESAPGFQRSR